MKRYDDQYCPIAHSLGLVGERWSLLVVRDAFLGVRRFNDFSRHLRIPRAVLTERLGFLVDEGVMIRVPGPGRHPEYCLTEKGLALWPVVRSLIEWGDAHYAPRGPRRVFCHAGCGGRVEAAGTCARCGDAVTVARTETAPGPGYEQPGTDADPISVALSRPRLLLDPLPR